MANKSISLVVLAAAFAFRWALSQELEEISEVLKVADVPYLDVSLFPERAAKHAERNTMVSDQCVGNIVNRAILRKVRCVENEKTSSPTLKTVTVAAPAILWVAPQVKKSTADSATVGAEAVTTVWVQFAGNVAGALTL
ncbi:hypothetical protein CYMTET_18428 [Cymbomonas tetramitiformis]|uniref:Uncharacterized protein n=1 Tax=Cymbomonas tetramitiformis TaxID=36881 RepID=A0AAE0G827_9CHLO|nr:hypothetical protein CYMTET_18428 [Cymbomonas tetramitiformis]|eukprot:gene2424-3154_t